jgi:hypothetical protein
MTEVTSHFCLFGYLTISSFVHVIIVVENMHFDIGERFHKGENKNISWGTKVVGLVNGHTQHLCSESLLLVGIHDQQE